MAVFGLNEELSLTALTLITGNSFYLPRHPFLVLTTNICLICILQSVFLSILLRTLLTSEDFFWTRVEAVLAAVQIQQDPPGRTLVEIIYDSIWSRKPKTSQCLARPDPCCWFL